MEIQEVGVVGAGVMGRGVAHSLALAGFRVILVDVSASILEAAIREIANNVRLYALFDEGESANPQEVVARITPTTDYDALASVDYLVENVTEKQEVKRPVYETLDRICQRACIFAVNTSAIPITRIASMTERAPLVIGMHFMNPVPLKPMVEVIRAYHTADETIERSKALLAAMGKQSIVVEDSAGFVTNRVMMLTVNEAMYLLQEGVAPAVDIDRLFKQCFEHRMGPLETADMIGLDTVLLSLEVIYENLNDSKYRPCPLLRKMVDAGLFGRKSGQGFYDYSTVGKPAGPTQSGDQ
ncbi:MAG: 3-hydroxyacyl-CoA dehydrogenase family protein [Pseudomonadota bacterium]